MSTTHLCMTSDILAFAVRYALTRNTPSAGIIVHAIVKVWDSLQFWEQHQLVKEIRQRQDFLENDAQDQSEHREVQEQFKEWTKVYALPLKPEPSFSA